jgi:hypothetical protein
MTIGALQIQVNQIPHRHHCEEQSGVAISVFPIVETALLCSQ